jgi:hypothetical protein
MHNVVQHLPIYSDPQCRLLSVTTLVMPTSIISEFAAYVKNGDGFAGRHKLIDRVRFRPGDHGDYLSLKADSHRLPLWTVGRVSTGDLFVSPNGTFNIAYTNGTVDERIAGVRYRLRLVDPEHPELSPLFTSTILGLKSIQALYSGKDPKNLLETDGGYDQIRLSTKTFEKVSTLIFPSMSSLTLRPGYGWRYPRYCYLPSVFPPQLPTPFCRRMRLASE